MDEPTGDRPSSGGPREPGLTSAVGAMGQLLVFLAEGVRALFEFWLPRKYAAPEPVVEEDHPAPAEPGEPGRAADLVENIARKLAPYPGQEG